MNVGKQALLGGQQLPCPVHINAAALQHQIRLEAALAELSRDLARYIGVVLEIRVFRPTVEAPMRDGDVAPGVLHEERAIIARPASIGRMVKKLDGIQIRVGFFQDLADVLFHDWVFDDDANTLHVR